MNSGTVLEKPIKEGENPVREIHLGRQYPE